LILFRLLRWCDGRGFVLLTGGRHKKSTPIPVVEESWIIENDKETQFELYLVFILLF
jgi:hypothetical protein